MRRNAKKHIFRILAILVIAMSAAFASAEILIGLSVKRFSQTAQAHFPVKRVEALMAMVECETCGMNDRNHAAWALGQLDDPLALPILERHYTGAECEHIRNLCQDTLQTAIRHLRHRDKNRSESLLWRWMLPTEK